jgi:hypothetical protein
VSRFLEKLRGLFKGKDRNNADLAELFRQELGIINDRPRSRFRRIVQAARKWTQKADFVFPWISCCMLGSSFLRISNLVWVKSVWSFTVLVCWAMIRSIGVYAAAWKVAKHTAPDDPKKQKQVIYETLFGVFAIIGIIGLWTSEPLGSWIPFIFMSFFWIFNGIRLGWVEKKMTVEEEVREAFDAFVAEHRPDLVDQDSKLNRELYQLESKLRQARTILSKLDGERRVAEKASSPNLADIEAQISRLKNGILGLENQKTNIEASKAEMISALQSFEAICHEATSYVRLNNLYAEADTLIGEGMANAEISSAELERIRQRIYDGLMRFNEAARSLGFAAVAELPDPSLRNFEERVLEVAKASDRREEKILRIAPRD